ncbi:EF hand domain-containing protein [Litorimonas taeanensis]|uniref:EF hand domain-containing protein n=1 Tax=Litorimonas taeanensis TaxID=568099 RepID=A0A420WES1_9PROT|nr:EF-hand domain-containing protein [Litorimonas taeanensis]RKQ69480.1 EF hand domain-containing protein [Litorimonas taeanensis]
MLRYTAAITTVMFSFALPISAIAAPKIDANNDGRITEREYMNYYSAEFINTDKNFDSRLTQEEIQKANFERFKKIEAEKFHKLDTDNNKVVSIEEFDAEQHKRQEVRNERSKTRNDNWFDEVDENRNGYISRAEYVAYRDKQTEKYNARIVSRTKKQFETMDSDKDGALTETEYVHKGQQTNTTGVQSSNNPFSHIRSATSLAKKNAQRDGDGDGFITKSEDEAYWRQTFEAQDKDKDGYIVKSENAYLFSDRGNLFSGGAYNIVINP